MTTIATSTTAKAADDWTRELSHAAESLSKTAHDIQKSFHRIQNERQRGSSNANKGEQLPDPVALVRRLAFLEAAIQRLGSDCTKITEQKRDFVASLLALQVENVQLLREISQEILGEEVPTIHEELENEPWGELASTVEDQCELFSRQVNDP